MLERLKNAINVTRTYRNFPEVIAGLRDRKVPLHAFTRDGKEITAENERQLWIIKKVAEGDNVEFGTDGSVEFTYGGRRLKFIGYKENGDIESCFLAGVYRFLAPKGEAVIDIGANIGDSSIWFALNGARRVYAVEPYPQNHIILMKNTEENKLGEIIKPVLSMISATSGEQTIDVSLEPSPYRKVHNADVGETIPSLTLEDLVKTIGLSDGLLKMDCEGCEYEALLTAGRDVVRAFRRIIIEYHYGLDKLVEHLRHCGFSVKYSKPHRYVNTHDYNADMMLGMIWASRIDRKG